MKMFPLAGVNSIQDPNQDRLDKMSPNPLNDSTDEWTLFHMGQFVAFDLDSPQ